MSSRTMRGVVRRWAGGGGFAPRPDAPAAEEPLEVRIDGAPVTVTMRTPGDDIDPVLGLLVGEAGLTLLGFVRGGSMNVYAGEHRLHQAASRSAAAVALAPGP